MENLEGLTIHVGLAKDRGLAAKLTIKRLFLRRLSV